MLISKLGIYKIVKAYNFGFHYVCHWDSIIYKYNTDQSRKRIYFSFKSQFSFVMILLNSGLKKPLGYQFLAFGTFL